MGIFNTNYNKPGKGVDKLAPRSEGGTLFFEIFFRKFGRFVQINLLYLLTLIPTFLIVAYFIGGTISNAVQETFGTTLAGLVGLDQPDFNNLEYTTLYMITDLCIRFLVGMIFTIFWGMGPVTAGVHYIFRNYSREENSFILSDFWDAIKDNFKQSIIVFIIDIVVALVFFYSTTFYSAQTNFMQYAKYLLYCLILFYTMIHLFVYPLMVRYKLSIGKLFRNSALFAMASLPFSFLMIIILGLLTFGALYFGIFFLSGMGFVIFLLVYIILLMIIMYSFCGFIVSFNAECQINKHLDKDAHVEEKTSFK